MGQLHFAGSGGAVAALAEPEAARLPRRFRPMAPLVNAVARLRLGVHAKLLTAFLLGTCLVLGMGLLNQLVVSRMSERVADIARLQEKLDHLRQMEYLLTAQSHYRAMAILTRDDSNNGKIDQAKTDFARHLDTVSGMSPPGEQAAYDRIRNTNARFATSSARVLDLYRAGDIEAALRLHLAEEHPITHELEGATRDLEQRAINDTAAAKAAYDSDRSLLTELERAFALVSVALALVLGFAFSWAIILPLRTIGAALGKIAAGDFAQRVAVANRDELGQLGRDVNTTSEHLARIYGDLQALNANLQDQVAEQVAVINRQRLHEELTRYDLQRAREIQERLLPASVGGISDAVELASRFQSARETSGDFVDVFPIAGPAHRSSAFAPLQIVVGDVAGKGIGAALVMALTRTAVRAVAQCADAVQAPVAAGAAAGPPGYPIADAYGAQFPQLPQSDIQSPATTLRLASAVLHRDVGFGAGGKDFVACAIATVEPPDGSADAGATARLRLANAAQVPPLLCRAGAVEEIVPPGEHLPMGVLPDPMYTEVTVDLSPGDVVVFASDGLPEAPACVAAAAVEGARAAGATPEAHLIRAAQPGELFGFHRLAASAAFWSTYAQTAEGVAEGIWSDALTWCGGEHQHDDMTLLVLRVPGDGPPPAIERGAR